MVLRVRGTIWYRLVGVAPEQTNLTADAQAAVKDILAQMNVLLTFTPLRDLSTYTGVAGARPSCSAQ